LNPIDPKLSLVFIGDVMPAFGKELQVSDALQEFIRSADYLVLNLEGVISADRYAWNGLRHDPAIMTLLTRLFPAQRTIVSCANNHAADCGWTEFNRSWRLLEERGFAVVGRRDRPSAILGNQVQITTCTFWSNQRCGYIARPEDVAVETHRDTMFNILYPHWGYELHLYPTPRQTECARELLRVWDMIIGHHAHTPQPITNYGTQLVAYSLGDFCMGIPLARWHHGMIAKTTVGPDRQGRWCGGRVEWRFTTQKPLRPNRYLIDLAGECSLFPE
jgi:poly-gamma-glutamate capsule biosynthesis protein CapA/YwtB (metallophosphatase superfamily)